MKDLTLKDIIGWIIDHSDDEEAMTKISVTAYPFSSRFKQRYPDRVPHREEDFPIDIKI